MDSSDDEFNTHEGENIEIIELDANANPTGKKQKIQPRLVSLIDLILDEIATDMLNAGIEDDYEIDEDDEAGAAGEEMEIIYDNSVYTIDRHTGKFDAIF